MRYSAFHALHIGAAHVRKGLPCQDRCLSEAEGRYSMAVVSDGHGNRRHFRSERGAELACEIALTRIREFLAKTDELRFEEREALIPELKIQICRDWRAAVLEDIRNRPWTQEEVEEQKQLLNGEEFLCFESGENAVLAYGCTLCAVFASDWGWGALQIGDGCLTVVEADGTYRWPMPESIINSGHITFSLCADNPMEDFRHVMEDTHPAGLMVYSDGIEKPFPSQGREIIDLLHWIWKNQRFGDEHRMEALEDMLGRVTQGSPIGDDVSIAGMVDMDAEDAEPVFRQTVDLKELRGLESQREELLTTIRYNRRRLDEIGQDESKRKAQEQILRILSRREADLEAITREIDQKRAQLGLPPLQAPEEEPEEQEAPVYVPMPEQSVPQDQPEEHEEPEDRYFWGDGETEEPASQKEINRTEAQRATPEHDRLREQHQVPLPRQWKSSFDPRAEIEKYFNEMLDGMANILDSIRKRR